MDRRDNTQAQIEQRLLEEVSNNVKNIGTEVAAHGQRLGRIEDAIIQLAATQERVRNIEKEIHDFQKEYTTFESETRACISDNREQIGEFRISTTSKIDIMAEKLKDLEKFKDNSSPEIAQAITIRHALEKIVMGIVLFVVLGVVGSYFVFSKPSSDLSKKIDRIELLIERHTKTPSQTNDNHVNPGNNKHDDIDSGYTGP